MSAHGHKVTRTVSRTSSGEQQQKPKLHRSHDPMCRPAHGCGQNFSFEHERCPARHPEVQQEPRCPRSEEVMAPNMERGDAMLLLLTPAPSSRRPPDCQDPHGPRCHRGFRADGPQERGGERNAYQQFNSQHCLRSGVDEAASPSGIWQHPQTASEATRRLPSVGRKVVTSFPSSYSSPPPSSSSPPELGSGGRKEPRSRESRRSGPSPGGDVFSPAISHGQPPCFSRVQRTQRRGGHRECYPSDHSICLASASGALPVLRDGAPIQRESSLVILVRVSHTQKTPPNIVPCSS